MGVGLVESTLKVGIVCLYYHIRTIRGQGGTGFSACSRRLTTTLTATEQAGGPSGRDVSLLVHYAPTYLCGYRTQATACALRPQRQVWASLTEPLATYLPGPLACSVAVISASSVTCYECT